MDNGYQVVVDPTPKSFSYTYELSLEVDTSCQGKTIRLPPKLHTSYCINLHQVITYEKATAFKKNNGTFWPKRLDVF